MPPPAIVLAFANDWVDDQRHLRNLLAESKAIQAVLEPLVGSGAILSPHIIHNATVDDVLAAFRAPRLRDRIRVFHFGGHANGSALLFEDEQGARARAHANGLAGYLGQQPSLELVFLNGCCTEPQVRRLRKAGVKAVVATTSAIEDAVAAAFAKAFYAELVTRSLADAFDAAVHEVRARWGDDPRAVTRELARDERPHAPPTWPWILDCDPEHKTWTLAQPPTPAPSTWPRRIAVGLGLTALVGSATALILPPSTPLAEQFLWTTATAHPSGDGLRDYLDRHPDGTFADQAQARLAACVTERIEALGPEREKVYPSFPINPDRAHPLPSKAEARRAAQTRGDQDAAAYCGSVWHPDELLSASATPTAWKCLAVDGGHTCGFEADIVCRYRQRQTINRERCNDRSE